jgi:hypothetical protein
MFATLGEDSLNVTEATITAHFNCPELVHVDGRWHCYDGLLWNLEIYTELPADYEFEGQTYVDSVSIRFVIYAFRIPRHSQRWADLVGQIIKWQGTGQPEGGLTLPKPQMHWVWDEDISHSTLSFLDFNEHSLRILWKGTTDNEPRAFSIDTWVRFNGIAIYRDPSDTRTMEEILAEYFDPSDFTQPPSAFPRQHTAFFAPRV